MICFPVVDFFNRINLLYGTICEYCTDQTCPTMSGGPRYAHLTCYIVVTRKDSVCVILDVKKIT